jgi:ribose 5-phosphate isomerase B
MKIALGADHKGFAHKNIVKSFLLRKGIDVTDFGAFSEESTDYSDYALQAAREIASGKADLGVLVCWTGNGMAIASNKVRGIRAALVLNPEMAQLARSHNNANILVLSGKYTPEAQLNDIVERFLSTPFEGGRHQRRLDKIKKYEDDNIC